MITLSEEVIPKQLAGSGKGRVTRIMPEVTAMWISTKAAGEMVPFKGFRTAHFQYPR